MTMYEYEDKTGWRLHVGEPGVGRLAETNGEIVVTVQGRGIALPPIERTKLAAVLDPEAATLRAQLAEATARAERAEGDLLRYREAYEGKPTDAAMLAMAPPARRDIKPENPASAEQALAREVRVNRAVLAVAVSERDAAEQALATAREDGRREERVAVVMWLRGGEHLLPATAGIFADDIESGEHAAPSPEAALGDDRAEQELAAYAASDADMAALIAEQIAVAAEGSGTAEPSPCRRCSECTDAEHHWMEDFDDGEWEHSPEPRPVWSCKHCDLAVPYESDDPEDDWANYQAAMIGRHTPPHPVEPGGTLYGPEPTPTPPGGQSEVCPECGNGSGFLVAYEGGDPYVEACGTCRGGTPEKGGPST
jgi:hypothetical protein